MSAGPEALVGKKFVDMTLTNVADKKEVKLSDFVGNGKPAVIISTPLGDPVAPPAAKKLNEKAKEGKVDAHYIAVCIEKDMSNAVTFGKNNLSDKVIHLQGRANEISQYGLRYIPHMCVVDKTGKVVMNYNGDAYEKLAKL
eukprot:CAMPEP_0185263268 /NCGR_PEP_ID=MMETSP1359-20130426/13195_1 /TAXON_ID=552665 /ORGANISM="Bigelowiella longifila, Strain CCMP242" /LENGTH=140 /DNA_ID=CAMNT_0027850623 /DNA_START=29 /DNA_END=451 /DNA_ORIENTATION=+